MKTLDTQWVEELRQQTAEDILYYPMQRKMEELEQHYLAFRSTLSAEERALLDEYHLLQKKNSTGKADSLQVLLLLQNKLLLAHFL